MTKTYKVTYTYKSAKGCRVSGVVNADRLAEIESEGSVLTSCIEYTPVIRYRTAEGCARCTTDEYVPHYNCLYSGKASGHSASHCTADSCF